MRVWRGRTGTIHTLLFTADGRLVTAGGRAATLAVWDLGVGRVAARLRGHAGRVRAAAIDPGGRLLAAADTSGRMIVWDLGADELREKARAEGFPGVGAIAFAPGGGWLAAAGRRLYAWDLQRGVRTVWNEGGPVLTQLLALVGLTRARSLTAGAFTPDGALFAWARRGVRSVQLRDVATGRELDGLRTAGAVGRLAFSPDGRRLAAITGRVVTLWDVAARTVVARPAGHAGPVYHLAFSPDGRLLATAGADGTVRFYDPAGDAERRCFAWNAGPVRSVAFALDGLTCAAGVDGGRIIAWDVDA